MALDDDKRPHETLAGDAPGAAAGLAGLGGLGAILEFLPMDVIQGMLLRLGLPLLKKTGKTVGKNAFGIGKELIGGYVKWKIMELAYRWGRRYLIERKRKKQEHA